MLCTDHDSVDANRSISFISDSDLTLVVRTQPVNFLVESRLGDAIDDAIDEALAATDMDTSLFVPIGVEEIREGTVRTEIIEDRDTLLTNIAAAGQTAYDDAIAIDADTVAAEAAREAAISEQREDLLTVTTIVEREAEPDPAPVVDTGNPPPVDTPPEAIVVSKSQNQSTQFTSGRFSHKSSIYVNPYNVIAGKNLKEIVF